MSYKIKTRKGETKITLTRGDTLKTYIVLTDSNGDVYYPEDGDSIRFAMKKKYSDEDTLLHINVPIDTMILHIKPENTKNLDYDDYVFDIELTNANGDVDTFVKGTLTLTEEVE